MPSQVFVSPLSWSVIHHLSCLDYSWGVLTCPRLHGKGQFCSHKADFVHSLQFNNLKSQSCELCSFPLFPSFERKPHLKSSSPFSSLCYLIDPIMSSFPWLRKPWSTNLLWTVEFEHSKPLWIMEWNKKMYMLAWISLWISAHYIRNLLIKLVYWQPKSKANVLMWILNISSWGKWEVCCVVSDSPRSFYRVSLKLTVMAMGKGLGFVLCSLYKQGPM